MILNATDVGGVWVAGAMDSRSIESPRYNLNDPRTIDELFEGGRESSSGELVGVETALCLSAVWQIVSMISADIAKLPLSPYSRTTDDTGEEVGKKINKTHPAWRLLRKQANEYQPSYNFRKAMMFCALMCNNSYAYIERRGNRPVAMRLLNPLKTGFKQAGRDIYIESSDNLQGRQERYELVDIVHIAGPSWDGFEGLDIIRYARDTFGMALAAQRFTSRFFKNGVQAGGFLELPFGATKKQADALEEGFYKKFHNTENHFRTLVLRDGAKWQPNTFNAKDADLKELRNQAKVDVCNFYNVNPAKVGVPGYSSYNSQYQANREYLDNCLSTHMENESSAYEPKLLSEKEYIEDVICLEHDTSRLLKMDKLERYNAASIGIRCGLTNRNEARAEENLAPFPGGEVFASPPELSFGSSGGGADNLPADPSQPNEPGNQVNAKPIRSVDLTRVIFKITDHARAKCKSAKCFCEWMKGGLVSHRLEAEAIGVDAAIVDQIRMDFESIKADDATISAQVEIICRKWEAGQ